MNLVKYNNTLEETQKTLKSYMTQSCNFFNNTKLRIKSNGKDKMNLFMNYEKILNQKTEEDFNYLYSVNRNKNKFETVPLNNKKVFKNINVIFNSVDDYENDDDKPEFRETFLTKINKKDDNFKTIIKEFNFKKDNSNFGLKNIINEISNVQKKINNDSEEIKLLLKYTRETKNTLKLNLIKNMKNKKIEKNRQKSNMSRLTFFGNTIGEGMNQNTIQNLNTRNFSLTSQKACRSNLERNLVHSKIGGFGGTISTNNMKLNNCANFNAGNKINNLTLRKLPKI